MYVPIGRKAIKRKHTPVHVSVPVSLRKCVIFQPVHLLLLLTFARGYTGQQTIYTAQNLLF